MAKAKEMIGCILDTETSGIGGVVIESARMELTATPLEFVRIKPEDSYMDSKLYGIPEGVEMKLGALLVHGILPESLEGLEPFRGFSYYGKFVVGHNVDFDVEMTGYHGSKRICTLGLSRFMWPDLDCHKQEAVLLHIGKISKRGYAWALDLLKNSHRAADDVLNCSRILKVIIHMMSKRDDLKQHVESWEALSAFSLECKIPKVMPFGKFKDKPLDEVEQDWLDYMYKQPDFKLDRYLVSGLRRAGKTLPENA